MEQELAPAGVVTIDDDRTKVFDNLVEGEAFTAAVARIPSELLKLEEEELRTLAKPTRTDYALRFAFWNEVRVADANGTKVKVNRIYSGICTYNHWWAGILQNPEKLAWMLQPVREYEEQLEPLLTRVGERYHEILNLDIYDAKGRPVPAMVKLVLDAMRMLEGRVLGEAVQRVESKSLNVSAQVPAGVTHDSQALSMDAFNGELDQVLIDVLKRNGGRIKDLIQENPQLLEESDDIQGTLMGNFPRTKTD